MAVHVLDGCACFRWSMHVLDGCAGPPRTAALTPRALRPQWTRSSVTPSSLSIFSTLVLTTLPLGPTTLLLGLTALLSTTLLLTTILLGLSTGLITLCCRDGQDPPSRPQVRPSKPMPMHCAPKCVRLNALKCVHLNPCMFVLIYIFGGQPRGPVALCPRHGRDPPSRPQVCPSIPMHVLDGCVTCRWLCMC